VISSIWSGVRVIEKTSGTAVQTRRTSQVLRVSSSHRRLSTPAAALDADKEGRLGVRRDLQIVSRTVMELMKAIADHDPRDVGRIAKVNSSWAEIFSGLMPARALGARPRE